MKREQIRSLMDATLEAQGKQSTTADGQTLRDLGFRSLDFSELALRVEFESGRELDFEAAVLRSIETVGDVLDFLESASA